MTSREVERILWFSMKAATIYGMIGVFIEVLNNGEGFRELKGAQYFS